MDFEQIVMIQVVCIKQINMKTLLSIIFLITALTINAQQNLHSFSVKTIDGEEFNLASLKGKKVLVVNTASRCGLTPQYKELQQLYLKYGGDNFEIIAFPANNFLNQEPGTNEEIQEFCSREYEITFPVMEKISVKGDDINPLYKWLTTKELNGKFDAAVTWNFQKFMIDENGNLVDFCSPRTNPLDEKIVNWIEGK